MTQEDPVDRLAAERGRGLGEIGVAPADEKWIHEEARTIASLQSPARRRGALGRFLYRLARKAARTAR
jgi:hypothetical protein